MSIAGPSTHLSMRWYCVKKARGQTMKRDYKRNGTTTLFAALDSATGQIFGQASRNNAIMRHVAVG